ncbi:hypothetical protein [Microbacterium sp. NPDC057944]|uniref:hypothetical protein n=1 Tax=Microbacterium sp. NPDC057944 TaxID=3346286 RepID=UPI0036D7946F
MTVIILDTNSMSRGQYSRSALDSLISAAGRAASVVIPEVVIWEWAEHAHSAHVALEEAVRSNRVDDVVIRRTIVEPVPPIDELVRRIEVSLPAGVQVWRPDSQAWRLALREQILQMGSGETKNNVKTGASDAVVLACVESESAVAEDVVVILTGDKRLQRSAARFGNVRHATGAGGLLAALRTFTPATDDLAVRLMEQLPEYLNERFGDHAETLSFHEHGVIIEVGTDRTALKGKAELAELMITQIDIAEIGDLRVEVDGNERVGLAELRVFGNILGDIVTFHEVAPGVVGASRETVDFSSDFVDVTIAVRWDQTWRIDAVLTTGEAVLVLVDPSFEEDEEALRFRAEVKA